MLRRILKSFVVCTFLLSAYGGDFLLYPVCTEQKYQDYDLNYNLDQEILSSVNGQSGS